MDSVEFFLNNENELIVYDSYERFTNRGEESITIEKINNN